MMAKLLDNNVNIAEKASSVDSQEPLDLNRTICNMFKFNIKTDDIMLFDMIRNLYVRYPDSFKINGTIHNSPDGTKTYFAVKINVIESWSYNMHVYGALRFNKFTVSHYTMSHKGKEYTADVANAPRFI